MTEEKEDKSYDLEERLIDFAVRVIRMAESLPKTKVAYHIAGQLLRCNGYQDRINRKAFYFKVVRAKRFHPSTFDIRYSIFCGSLSRPSCPPDF
jgi:hypothetical protein